MNNSETIKNNDSRKILGLVVIIATLMITTTGATYAWLTFTGANNATTVTGTVASTGSMTLTITEAPLKSGNTGKMVPQLDDYVGTAMNGTNKCVDGNNNIVCKVYTIHVEASGDAEIPSTGQITFSNIATVPNLKWSLASSATSISSNSKTTASTTAATFATPTFTASNRSADYYLVIWISEINAAQNDSGTWNATISFESAGGGHITSTITSAS